VHYVPGHQDKDHHDHPNCEVTSEVDCVETLSQAESVAAVADTNSAVVNLSIFAGDFL